MLLRVAWLMALAAMGTGLDVAAAVVEVGERDLQQVIDAAAPNAVIACDPNRQLTLAAPVVIDKPLTLRGLCAKLPEKLGKTSLVVVKAKGVTITEFNLTGNVDSVPQSERAPLIVIAAGDFRVENGKLSDSSKDGIMIDGGFLGAEAGDLVGGVVRDVVGRKIARDVVSISGSGGTGQRVRNVLVDNIRGLGSSHRGCVEVSDGAENITVRKVYAEDSVYAVDIQDHGEAGQVDRHVVVEDVFALRCKHAIRTANKALGHAHVTLRDVTARECEAPLRLTNIENLTVGGVRVIDPKGDGPAVSAKNCGGLVLRDVTVENAAAAGPVVLVEDCDGALIDGVSLRGKGDGPTSVVTFRLRADRAFSGVRIVNVSAGGRDAPIVLERAGEKGLLGDYVVSANAARVMDQIRGPRAVVGNNLP